MGFARGFLIGQQIAQGALDTYEKTRERRLLSEYANAKPEEIRNAYTSQDAEQLHAIANAKDAQGNPYYSLEANPDGSYGLKANFSYAGQDGQVVQPGGLVATFAPRSTVVEFLGNRYAPEDLTPERMEALRYRAMANVVAQRDPVVGLQMWRGLRADERADKEFAWKEQQQPLQLRRLEQEVRSGGLSLADAESAQAWKKGFGEHLASYTGSPEQIAAIAPYVNSNSKSITLGDPHPETGLVNLSVVKPDGSAVFTQLSRADQARLYAASRMLKTHPAEALKEISAVNKDLAEAVERENQLTKFLADNINDVAAQGHRMNVNERELGIRAAEADNRRAYYARAGQNILEFVDEKGQVRLVDTSALPRDQAGNVITPAGLRPKTAKPFSPADYAATVRSFVEAEIPLEEARRQADQLFGRAPATTPQAVLEVLKNMDRQAGQQRGAAPTVPAPPAPQGVNARLGVPTPELERLVREGRAPSARPDWSQVKPQGVPYGLPGWRLTQ